jgi:flagellar protein FlaG
MAAPVTADVLPTAPPSEVSEEVGLAFLRAEALAAADRQLHFAKDEASGRIIVEVRALDGTLIRTIPPSEALDVMSGASDLF